MYQVLLMFRMYIVHSKLNGLRLKLADNHNYDLKYIIPVCVMHMPSFIFQGLKKEKETADQCIEC